MKMHLRLPVILGLGVWDFQDHHGQPTKNISVVGHIIRKLDINAHPY